MMKNMRIGKRLGLGFGVMLLLILIVGITGYWGVNQSTTATIKMLAGDVSISEHAARLRANVIGMRRYEKDIFLNIGNSDKVAEYHAKWKEQDEHAEKRIADLDKIVVLAKEKEKIAGIKKDIADYNKGMAKVYGDILNSKLKTPQQCNEAISEYKKEIHELEAAAKEMAEEANKRADEQEKVMADLAKSVAMIVVSGIIVAVILCIIISILITRSITVPVNAAVQTAKRLAEGDLTVDVLVTSED